MDDWTAVMAQAQAFCAAHHIEWYELRNAVIDARVAENPSAWEGHGIGSSDGNHMIYSATKLGELPEVCAALVARGELLDRVRGERDPRQVLAELRELFAPAAS